MYATEDRLLNASKPDRLDRIAQRAVRVRRQVRALALEAGRLDDQDGAAAMELMHFQISVALLGLNELRPYEFVQSELAALKNSEPEPFQLRATLIGELDINEVEALVNESEADLFD